MKIEFPAVREARQLLTLFWLGTVATWKSLYTFHNVFLGRYEDSADAFRSRAQACVAEWKNRRFDLPLCQDDAQDPHYLTFSPYDPDTHGPVIKAMAEEVK